VATDSDGFLPAGLKSVKPRAPTGGIHSKTVHAAAAEAWAEKERQAEGVDRSSLATEDEKIGHDLYIRGLRNARTKAEHLDKKTHELERGWGDVHSHIRTLKPDPHRTVTRTVNPNLNPAGTIEGIAKDKKGRTKSEKLAENRFELEKKEGYKNYGELLYDEFKSKVAQDEEVAAREAAATERKRLALEDQEMDEIAKGRLIHKPTPYAWGDTVYTPLEDRSSELVLQKKKHLDQLRDQIDADHGYTFQPQVPV